MTDEFPLPPYEDVPGEVRDRLRDRVMGEITQRPRTGRRGSLAVAAGVAALVAVGLLVSHSMLGMVTATAPPTSTHPFPVDIVPVPGPDRTQPIFAPQSVSQTAVKPELDRCWAAITTAGKAGQYPQEATWKASFQLHEEIAPNSAAVGRTVTVVRADNEPLFCETTLTSVSVSDPTVRTTGAKSQVLMASQDGVLAGITSSLVTFPFVVTTADGPSLPSIEGRDGMWVAMTNLHGFQHSTMTVDNTQVTAPAAGVFVVDKPQNADRSSAAGQRLQTCLDTLTTRYGSLLDQASWQPGAAVTSGNSTLVITTNDQAVAVCAPGMQTGGEDGFFFAGPSALETAGVPIDLVYIDSVEGLFLGLIGPDVGSVRVSYGSQSVNATLVGGTFGALLPGGVPIGARVTYTVFDKQGHQLYSSTAPPSRPRG